MIGKRLTEGLGHKRISAIINLWGLILVKPFGLWAAWHFDFGAVSVDIWALLVFYALAASVWTVWLWMTGLKTVPAWRAGVFSVTLPISAAAIGVLFMGERLTSVQTLAFGIALLGLLLATLPGRKADQAHHRPVGLVMPIQSAHPDVAANARPARRMPQAPERPPRNRSNSHGPAVNDREVPAENKAMIVAPSTAFADSEATSNAEYNRPQGIKAHATPSTTGALDPSRPRTGRALRQTDCPSPSNQAGWRARQINTAPSSNAATWNMVQTGRMMAVCVPSHARPCTEPAANAPKSA